MSLVLLSISSVFGAALGSFLNVLILRYPHQMPTGRSYCPHCHHQLAARDLIPLLSWLVLRGRCRHCHAPVSIQYPFVELFTAISAIVLAYTTLIHGLNPIIGIILFAIVCLLIVLFIIDWRTMLLPDIYIFILTGFVLLLVLTDIYAKQLSALGRYATNNFALSLLDLSASSPWQFSRGAAINLSLWGAGLGAGSLLLLWYITAKQGIGFGDVKLMIPLGLLFGPIYTTLLLFTAFICGGALGSYLLITKRANLKTAVPFGPFLAGVAIIFILFPSIPQIILGWIF